MRITFTKAHGCGNDFLLVDGKPEEYGDAPALARAVCDRHFGIGADGLYFLDGSHAHLYNSDGSAAELSGNGTRCAAALLVERGAPSPVVVHTGAGPKEFRLVERSGHLFEFEMSVGKPEFRPGPEGALDIWIGNPQCIVFVEHFDFDWQRRGAELEAHPHFPNKTNVEFVRVDARHAIEIRIWERGAGHTLSSGTGATASATAAIHAGRCASPVTVRTEGGVLEVSWDGADARLTGPAEIIARGEFLWKGPAL